MCGARMPRPQMIDPIQATASWQARPREFGSAIEHTQAHLYSRIMSLFVVLKIKWGEGNEMI